MTQINSNFNIQNYAGQQQKQQQTVRIPNYYYVPDTYSPQSVKEVVKENPFYDVFLKPFVEHPVAVLATWLGLGVGLDAYSTACSGKYEDSLVKKAANFGDNIQNSKINLYRQLFQGWVQLAMPVKKLFKTVQFCVQ